MKHIALVITILLCVAAFGQEPQFNKFSLNLSPISLPGNHQTVAGTEAGAALTVTPNFDVGTKDIVAPGQNFQYWAGMFNYRIPWLSRKLNSVSPTLNGMSFEFGATGSVGMSRITLPVTQQHWGETIGGFVNYKLGGGRYTLGAEIQYVKFPGLTNNNLTVSLDPSIRF